MKQHIDIMLSPLLPANHSLASQITADIEKTTTAALTKIPHIEEHLI
jgi:hypothetical protein